MYYPAAQQGTNGCAVNRGGCQHLCFGLTGGRTGCKCAIGYYTDPLNKNRCLGEDEFVLYSVSHELKGVRLAAGQTATGQLSKVRVDI